MSSVVSGTGVVEVGVRLRVRRRLVVGVAAVSAAALLVALPSVGRAAAVPVYAGVAAPAAVRPAAGGAVAGDVNPGNTDGDYVPLQQTTVVDTRSGVGLPAGKLAANTPVTFTVAGGTTGVPSSGVDAVAVTFTLTNTSGRMSFTAWSAGQPKPATTIVTGQPGQNQSSNAYIKPGTNNQLTAQTDAGTTDLLVSVIGYFKSTDNAAGFSPVPGRRVVDTRNGIGAPKAKIPAGGYIEVSVAGAGVPTSASAAVVSITTFSTVNSYINLGRPGQTGASSISVAGDNYPTTTTQIAQVANAGMRINVGPAADLDVLVDVTGFFDAVNAGGGFTPVSGRAYDSGATGNVAVPANGVSTITILGKGGVPTDGDHATVGAVAIALTVASTAAAGYARIYADGIAEPTSIQTITFEAGDTTTNSAIVATSAPATGRLLIHNFSSQPLHVIIDTQGWFSPYYGGPLGSAFAGGPGAQSFSQFTSFGITTRDRLRVNAANGNGLYSADDVSIAGTGLDLDVSRHYNSRSTDTGSFGPGWSADMGGDINLVADGANRVLWGTTGTRITFESNTSGGWKVPAGLHAVLTNAQSGFELRFDSSGEVWTFTLDGQLDKRADRNGNTIDYTYDANGALTSVTDTRDRTLAITRTAGLITQLRLLSPGGSVLRTWNYGYTGGKLSSFTDPAGQVTGYSYDATTGRLTSVTNPRNVALSLTTDSDGRVLTLTRGASGPVYQFGYQLGRTRSVDPNGNVTLFLVNSFGGVTATVDALGHMQSRTYDDNANVTDYTPASTADGGTPFTTSYDTLNRPTTASSPTGATTKSEYGAASNVYAPSKVTDAQGASTSYTYDAAGNAETATDSTPGQGKTVTHHRNQAGQDGQVSDTVDPKGTVTTYNYDAAGQLTSVDRPAPLGDESSTYDGLSRLVTVTVGTGAVRTYTYDGVDRVTEVTATGAATITSAYDGAGNRTSQTDATGTSTSTYDPLNRVTQQDPSVGGQAVYTYDGVGNLLTHRDVTGTTTYRYNSVNKPDQLTEPDGQVTGFTYDADNRRTKVTWPGGVTQSTDYDAAGRITRVRGLTAGSTALTDLSYTYRLVTDTTKDQTLVQTVKDNLANQTTAYTYDGLSRLTQAQTKNSAATVVKTYAYAYDKNGNRTRASTDGTGQTSAFNASDQICWTGGAGTSPPQTNACSDTYSGLTRYAYDADGNQTTTTPPSATASTATFNAYDQTTGFTPGGGVASTPTYTGATQNGRATTTDQLGTTTRGVTLTRTVLGVTARTSTNPATTETYVRDPSGTLLTWRTGTTKRAYLTDRQGSVIAVVNTADGTVDRRYTYDPYGATTKTANAEQYDTNPWRYTGAYQDNTTSLYKLGARYYQPTLGRFTQADPSGQEANTYLYAGANAVNRTDPSGLDDDEDVFGPEPDDLLKSATAGCVGGAYAGAVAGGQVVEGCIGGATVSVAAEIAGSYVADSYDALEGLFDDDDDD